MTARQGRQRRTVQRVAGGLTTARNASGGGGSRGAVSDAPLALLGRLSEREFQADVVHGLRQRGFIVWTVPDMRMTTAGLPDLIAVHPDRAPLLMWELKTERGRVRPEQVRALAHLDRIPGIDARIVRPADWLRLKETV